jgi:hypothetical protein
MLVIEQYSRWTIKEIVPRSQDMRDVHAYPGAERILEMVEVMPFVTVDSVSFEKKTSLSLISDGIRGKN